MKKLFFITILFLLSCSISWATTYDEVRSDFIDQKEYLEQRQDMYKLLKANGYSPPTTSCTEMLPYMKTLGLQDYPLSIAIVNNIGFNAYCLPGGYMFIGQELLDSLTRDELMFVINHEYGHCLNGDGISSRNTGLGLILLNIIVGFAADKYIENDSTRDIVKGGIALTSIAGFTAYSRSNEETADICALKHIQILGLNPNAGITLFEKIRNKSVANTGSQALDNRLFFSLSTHPSLDDRIAYLKEELRENDPTLAKYGIKNTAIIDITDYNNHATTTKYTDTVYDSASIVTSTFRPVETGYRYEINANNQILDFSTLENEDKILVSSSGKILVRNIDYLSTQILDEVPKTFVNSSPVDRCIKIPSGLTNVIIPMVIETKHKKIVVYFHYK